MTVAWPLIRVVDNLNDGRVLFDFNPGQHSGQERWVAGDDFDLGSPEWDSSPVGIIEGTRTITLGLRTRGRGAEAGMAVLAEILTRTAPPYLQFQTRPDSEPLWFRLRRQQQVDALDFGLVWTDDVDASVWRWKVALLAEAFALGAREDLTLSGDLSRTDAPALPPVEVLEQIKGTAPAPLAGDLSLGALDGVHVAAGFVGHRPRD